MSELRKYTVEFLKVLADPTRLEILDQLKYNEKNASDIQDEMKPRRSQSTISKHLKILVDNNLIDFEKKDNIKYYKIKNNDIFTLLSNINSTVANINTEKLKDLRDVDIYDTLY
ncbi:MAG: ArsR/SmtB family transcription factor [Candidatus Thorarchaeota archaeon]